MVKKTALFIDDQPEYLHKMIDLIRNIGFDCRIVSSPVEAIELLESRNFDLVVTDILMPGRDGFAVIDSVRTRSSSRFVVAVSGCMDDAVERAALDRGVHAFFTKPLDLDAFVRELASIYDILCAGNGVS